LKEDNVLSFIHLLFLIKQRDRYRVLLPVRQNKMKDQ
jgi:hypothetical protein